MPTAIASISPTVAHPTIKQNMSMSTNFGAGGKPLPETYKWVLKADVELIERSSGNEAIDTMAFLHLLEQLKVGFGFGMG